MKACLVTKLERENPVSAQQYKQFRLLLFLLLVIIIFWNAAVVQLLRKKFSWHSQPKVADPKLKF